MSVSRGTFLKALGKSIPGMVLGGGVATAAQKLLGKMAAASGTSNPREKTVAHIPPAMDAKMRVGKIAPVEFIKSGPATGNRIALTFDDGPTPGVTDRILDELKQRKLHATFFMIGERIATAPDLARRVLAEGHDVGNHTFTHPNLTKLPQAQADVEIQKTQDIMRDVMNHRPAFFRPPFGALRQTQAGMLATRGMRIVFWSIDTEDWSQPGADKIAGTALAHATAGSIILCHDVHAQTADSVGAMLDGLLERGFLPSTLSALLG